MELWSDESCWHLERTVLMDSAAGQDHLLEFPSVQEREIDSVIARLPVACSELLSTIREFVSI
jgi:hypothetical protein